MKLTRTTATTLTLFALALAGCGGGGEPAHAGHDHEPPGASSDEVTLTSEQVKASGIEVQAAGPGAVSVRLRLTAVVQENLDAQAHLTPKVPGLVRSVKKRLGDRVAAGDVLCVLESTVLGEAASRYREARATLHAARRSLQQETALLTSSVHLARTIFARERRLKDQEITTLRPYYQAEKALAEARLGRDRRLLALRREVRQHEIQLQTAEERLRILGLGAGDLRALDRGEERGHGRYPLRAPRAGVIVDRDITENEYVDTSSKLFLIQDLRRVWVVASVYERDLRRVARGQAGRVRLQAFPGVTLRGEVTFIDYRVDPTSRACKVRVELPNAQVPGWKEPFPLRPGMFGTVELVLATRQANVTVPERAIVHEGERSYVFVAAGAAPAHDGHDGHDEHAGEDDHDGEAPRRRFLRRAVQLGANDGERVEVVRGLAAGDRVVVAGTFTLKSAARQGELGGGHSH